MNWEGERGSTASHKQLFLKTSPCWFWLRIVHNFQKYFTLFSCHVLIWLLWLNVNVFFDFETVSLFSYLAEVSWFIGRNQIKSDIQHPDKEPKWNDPLFYVHIFTSLWWFDCEIGSWIRPSSNLLNSGLFRVTPKNIPFKCSFKGWGL